jgi:hypothetical protein
MAYTVRFVSPPREFACIALWTFYGQIRSMKRPRLLLLILLLLLLDVPLLFADEPNSSNVAAFTAYSRSVESRLATQHRSPQNFLGLPPSMRPRLLHGELLLEDLTPPAPPPSLEGALLHHWRGTLFVPNATATDFEHLLRNFTAYPQHFSPEVLQARVLRQTPNNILGLMRVRQHHVLTVVLDTTYDITFGQLDAAHGYSISHSTRVDEIASAGTRAEHALSPADNHGFLWRQDTFWSYEERDGGLYLQIESLSLTRAIPSGLGWAVRPFVNSIPRESLEFTLRSAANAIRK